MPWFSKKPADAEVEKISAVAKVDETDKEKDEPTPLFENPACPRCGWHNVRPSAKKGMLDLFLAIFALQAFRCRSCGRRFHAIRRSAGN